MLTLLVAGHQHATAVVGDARAGDDFREVAESRVFRGVFHDKGAVGGVLKKGIVGGFCHGLRHRDGGAEGECVGGP